MVWTVGSSDSCWPRYCQALAIFPDPLWRALHAYTFLLEALDLFKLRSLDGLSLAKPLFVLGSDVVLQWSWGRYKQSSSFVSMACERKAMSLFSATSMQNALHSLVL